ncbi:MAG: DUF6145 family protein [Eubacteriales bacterium]|nr:DUF6145 family protein [Eubacteriales bacterium]
MYQEKVVLCGANAYNQKFYINEDFDSLPQAIKDELKIMCVLYVQDIGGILTLEYDEEGNLCFRTDAESDDFGYDEIGSVLKIRQIQRTKTELLEALEMYYRVFFMQGGDHES